MRIHTWEKGGICVRFDAHFLGFGTRCNRKMTNNTEEGGRREEEEAGGGVCRAMMEEDLGEICQVMGSS